MEIEGNNKHSEKLYKDLSEALPLTVELRKRKEKTLITLSHEDLLTSKDKILIMLKKECADLKSWFFIIVSTGN